jgi:DMSO reductase anchor subunit
MANNPAYYGQPIIKAPVWTWQVGLYFFVGGTAGMSGVIALAGLVNGAPLAFVQAALTLAVAGAVISPILLIWDLGRPSRFLNMLRLFKWRSAMSVGVWTLVTFSAFAGSAWLLSWTPAFRPLLFVVVAGTAVCGAVLATYVGVLLGATAVPVWSSHHRLLPFHFGMVALGSAAASLELLGFHLPALNAIGVAVALVETGVGASIELARHDPSASVLTQGASGMLLRVAGVCIGPGPLVLRLLGSTHIAAAIFLIGALASRYGWLHAGRASARDPEQTLAIQRPRSAG